MKRLMSVLAVLAAPAMAQDIEVTPLEPVDPLAALIEELVEETAQVQTVSVNEVLLRGIDKLDGTVENINLVSGLPHKFGFLDVELGECRYPEDNPAGEAYAYLSVREGTDTVFEGWMIATSPALNAMDHQRYDIWVLRCKTTEAEGESE